jgi:hypothetical protein
MLNFFAWKVGHQERIVQGACDRPHQDLGAVADHAGVLAKQQHDPAVPRIAQERRDASRDEFHWRNFTGGTSLALSGLFRRLLAEPDGKLSRDLSGQILSNAFLLRLGFQVGREILGIEDVYAIHCPGGAGG